MIKNPQTALSTVFALMVAGMCSPATAARITALQSFPAPDGETYFAVAVKSDRPVVTTQTSRHHVLLVDTSASQVGAHREHGLAVLKSFLSALPETDRVTVFAVDVKPVRVTDSQLSPQAALQAALPVLNARFPAGSTDMLTALTTAQAELTGTASITYLGDGMSTANLIQQQDMQSLLADLVGRRIPVHTYAVGPNKDRQLLGILSHHTGGRAMSDLGSEQVTGPTDRSATGRGDRSHRRVSQ